MTKIIQLTPAVTEVHISQSRGVAPIVGVQTALARADQGYPARNHYSAAKPWGGPSKIWAYGLHYGRPWRWEA